MAKRKAIPEGLRHDIFKRDRFTCQYCGRTVPEVVLEIDHIKPVSKGGTNDSLNLITSCRACNRGKSNKLLSENTVVKKQQAQLEELAERKLQMEMLIEWHDEMSKIEELEVREVENILVTKANIAFNEVGKGWCRKWIKEFSFAEVLDATEKAIAYYYDGSQYSAQKVLKKISGICYVARKQKDDLRIYYANYTIKALTNKRFDFDKGQVKRFVMSNVTDDELFEEMKFILSNTKTFEYFKNVCENIFCASFEV